LSKEPNVAKPKRERPPPQYSDPTPERLAHAAGDLHDNWKEAIAQGRRPPPVRLVTMRDHPLERMLARKQINQRQFDAGQKLRGCWERAAGSGKIASIDWQAIFASDPATRLGGFRTGLDALRIWQAIQHLGRIQSSLVIAVACEGYTLQEVAPDFGRHPAGYGLQVVGFQFGKHLTKLADLWGL
jgi:hypothetical protein